MLKKIKALGVAVKSATVQFKDAIADRKSLDRLFEGIAELPEELITDNIREYVRERVFNYEVSYGVTYIKPEFVQVDIEEDVEE